MEKDQKVASEKDPKIDLFEDDDEFEEFNINEGSGCTIVWHTNAISAVLDLGQETKPHISPIRPLTPEEQLESVKKLEGLPNREHKNCKLKLFLEVDLGLDQHPIPLPDKTKEDILLFFKLYEPEKRKLRFFVKSLAGQ
ncbi:hypothetical protein ACFX2J_008746 [Malus domestica]